ncbi:hypothetical protein BH09BAC1_BH09BAC1_07440 [soil metagenome]
MSIELNPYIVQYSEFFTNTLNSIASAMDPMDPDINLLTSTIIGVVNTDYFGGQIRPAQTLELNTLPVFVISSYTSGEASQLSAYNMLKRLRYVVF